MTPDHLLHATCVAFGPSGVLILGKSGSGKSALALQLMAFGADLVADDQVEISLQDGVILARCPDSLKGKVEAYGMGVLGANCVDRALISVVIDMNHIEKTRMPPLRRKCLLGIDIALLHSVASPSFPAAVLQYVKGGLLE